MLHQHSMEAPTAAAWDMTAADTDLAASDSPASNLTSVVGLCLTTVLTAVLTTVLTAVVSTTAVTTVDTTHTRIAAYTTLSTIATMVAR
jgi:hypothetical protein